MAVANTRWVVSRALKSGDRKTLLRQAAGLERAAMLCDALFPWPALSASFKADAETCRKAARTKP
jgi:hypothetical protein